MRLPKPKKINAIRYEAGLNFFNKKKADIKLSANECALGPSPKAVKAYITHPVLSGPAIERLNNSSIDELVVTNSIPLDKEAKKCSKIRVISIANIIAECITRLSNEESLSEMFL